MQRRFIIYPVGWGKSSGGRAPETSIVPTQRFFHQIQFFQQMAGTKGKSGGPRKNAGGARPGAGRKPKKQAVSTAKKYDTDDALAWLKAFMRDPGNDMEQRKDAAKKLVDHEAKIAQLGGKKGEKSRAAQASAGGKFAASQPPPITRSH